MSEREKGDIFPIISLDPQFEKKQNKQNKQTER